MKKIISNIKPFNDIPLSGCFKHQLLTVIKNYNINPTPYLFNTLPIYKINKNKLIVKSILIKTNLNVLNNMGIRLLRKNKIDDLISYIKKQLANNRFVIVPCDTFSLPYRDDLYKKTHALHYILIYGFNDKNDSFFTIDHIYYNSFEYKKTKINYSDLSKSFSDFINYLKSNKHYLLYVIYKTNNNRSTTIINSIKSTKNVLYNNLEVLKKYIFIIKDLKYISKETIKSLYETFLTIRQNKEKEKYLYKYCIKNKNTTKYYNKTIYNYTLIISKLYKCYITKKYSKESLLYCVEILLIIYHLEKKILDKIYGIIESNEIF